MSNVKVAVRVRPLNKRETDQGAHCIIDMDGAKTALLDPKSRGSKKEFTYDYSYWSADPSYAEFAPQEKVFDDLGVDVIESAKEGYNACVFAYGQTGSGKTYTMMGTQEEKGLIPRICQSLFDYIESNSQRNVSFKTEVSYMEIYNEKVRDLLRPSSSDSKVVHNLKVREHPRSGPYVESLTKHLVSDYSAIEELMTIGNTHRVTASTLMNDVSSRSHAIFTISFTQAKFESDLPSETVSRINLVDLAGSERASATGTTGERLKEGSNINRSLVTLGTVISALADMSSKKEKKVFVPYRDSVLTWLLKDSLGGNAKTIMIATISPSNDHHGETLSTLRYANRAKSIVNKPTVNEDQNVKLIRELKAEIEKLKMIIGADKNLSERLADFTSENIHKKEEQVAALTKTWAGKWKDMQRIIEERELALHSEGVKMMVASEQPHFIGMDNDILSTGVVLYHLPEGSIEVGNDTTNSSKQYITLEAPEIERNHCKVVNREGQVTLYPGNGQCFVSGELVTEPTTLVQGSLVQFGRMVVLRFNHPREAYKMKEERRKSGLPVSGRTSSGSSVLSAGLSPALQEERERLERKRMEFERRQQDIEREFEDKVSKIREEVELEKEKLRTEMSQELEQHKLLQEAHHLSSRSTPSSEGGGAVHPEGLVAQDCTWSRLSGSSGSVSSLDNEGQLPALHERLVVGEEQVILPVTPVFRGSSDPEELENTTQDILKRSTPRSSETKPIRVSVPQFAKRRKGHKTYNVYEIKISAGNEEWSVFRRYREFEAMHQDVILKHPEVKSLIFPPKAFFGTKSDHQLKQRQQDLEMDFPKLSINNLSVMSAVVALLSQTVTLLYHSRGSSYVDIEEVSNAVITIVSWSQYLLMISARGEDVSPSSSDLQQLCVASAGVLNALQCDAAEQSELLHVAATNLAQASTKVIQTIQGERNVHLDGLLSVISDEIRRELVHFGQLALSALTDYVSNEMGRQRVSSLVENLSHSSSLLNDSIHLLAPVLSVPFCRDQLLNILCEVKVLVEKLGKYLSVQTIHCTHQEGLLFNLFQLHSKVLSDLDDFERQLRLSSLPSLFRHSEKQVQTLSADVGVLCNIDSSEVCKQHNHIIPVLSEVELCVERLVQRETVGAISHLLSSELSKLKHAAGRVTDVAKKGSDDLSKDLTGNVLVLQQACQSLNFVLLRCYSFASLESSLWDVAISTTQLLSCVQEVAPIISSDHSLKLLQRECKLVHYELIQSDQFTEVEKESLSSFEYQNQLLKTASSLLTVGACLVSAVEMEAVATKEKEMTSQMKQLAKITSGLLTNLKESLEKAGRVLRVIELEKCKDSLQVLHDEIFDLHKLESVHQPIQLKRYITEISSSEDALQSAMSGVLMAPDDDHVKVEECCITFLESFKAWCGIVSHTAARLGNHVEKDRLMNSVLSLMRDAVDVIDVLEKNCLLEINGNVINKLNSILLAAQSTDDALKKSIFNSLDIYKTVTSASQFHNRYSLSSRPEEGTGVVQEEEEVEEERTADRARLGCFERITLTLMNTLSKLFLWILICIWRCVSLVLYVVIWSLVYCLPMGVTACCLSLWGKVRGIPQCSDCEGDEQWDGEQCDGGDASMLEECDSSSVEYQDTHNEWTPQQGGIHQFYSKCKCD